MKEFRVEEREGFFEGVGFGTRDGAFDVGRIKPVRDEAIDQEVDRVLKACRRVVGALR